MPSKQNDLFFQLQLILILISLLLSLALNSTVPYFTASALTFLTALGTLVLELYSLHASVLETVTPAYFALLLTATSILALKCRHSLQMVQWHAATTLCCAFILSWKTVWILANDPISDSEADCAVLIATGFAAMHLLASILLMPDRSSTPPAIALLTPDVPMVDASVIDEKSAPMV